MLSSEVLLKFAGVSGSAAAALLQRLQGVKGLQGSMITTGAGGRPVLRLPLPNPNIRPQAQVLLVSALNLLSLESLTVCLLLELHHCDNYNCISHPSMHSEVMAQ